MRIINKINCIVIIGDKNTYTRNIYISSIYIINN